MEEAIEKLRAELGYARSQSKRIDLDQADRDYWVGYTQATANALAVLRGKEP